MSELPPGFVQRLAAINRRRMGLIHELRRNLDADMQSIHRTIELEVQTLYEEFEITYPESEEEPE